MVETPSHAKVKPAVKTFGPTCGKHVFLLTYANDYRPARAPSSRGNGAYFLFSTSLGPAAAVAADVAVCTSISFVSHVYHR